MSKKETYHVSLIRPEGVGKRQMIDYIRDAVADAKGALEPPNQENDWTGDPLFGLNGDSVAVTTRR